MTITAGTRLGAYEITASLGAGGMGEVYRGRDPRLGREIAIKVLPAWAAADEERRARFEREATIIASLNHPNIVTIYGVDDVDGVPLFTMEYVHGQTLTEMIPRSGFPLAELLRIAIPLTDAVGCAHQRDIVHRDLKPANVMVNADGRVKVLDFGLAKLREAAPLDDTRLQPTEQRTGEGRILGTVAYMSPEQAQGKPVDARSDVFSLGILLYEMATGERPFKGETSVSLLSSILRDTPRSVTELRAEVPRDLGRIIRRALHKDPERRYQSALDLRSDLQLLKDDYDSGELSRPPDNRAGIGVTRRRWKWVAGGVVLVSALAAAVFLFITRTESGRPSPRVSRLTSLPGAEQFPAFSPDGKQIAFTWNGEHQDNDDVYVQLVGEDSPHRRTTDPSPDRCPVWSPDGTRIAFVRGSGDAAAIYEMSSLGGEEKKLADFRPARATYWIGHTSCLSWSVTNWVASVEVTEDGRPALFAVNAESRDRRRLLVHPSGTGRYHWPAFSPDGRRLAFVACSGGYDCDLAVVGLKPDGTAEGETRRLTSAGVVFWGLDWSPDGQVVIYSAPDHAGGSYRLWRVDAAGGHGPTLLDGSGEDAILPAVSRLTGKLAFGRLRASGGIVTLPLDPSLQPTPFIRSTGLDIDPQFSPDGKRIAFFSDRSRGSGALWVANADGTNPLRLTERSGRVQAYPRWSPDSRWLTFEAQSQRGDMDVYAIEASGGRELQLTSDPADDWIPCWSSDGKRIYFASRRSGTLQVWALDAPPAQPGEPVQVTRSGGNDTSELDGILYYRRSTQLYRMRLPSGPEERVLDSVVLTSFVPFPDGLYYVTRSVNNPVGPSSFEFRFLDFATNQSRLLNAFKGDTAESLTVARDRKTALYSVIQSKEVDLMLLDNVR